MERVVNTNVPEPEDSALLEAVAALRVAHPDATAKQVHETLTQRKEWANASISAVKRACSKAAKQGLLAPPTSGSSETHSATGPHGNTVDAALKRANMAKDAPTKKRRQCSWCGWARKAINKNTPKCERCRTSYCSEACQRADWDHGGHQKTCRDSRDAETINEMRSKEWNLNLRQAAELQRHTLEIYRTCLDTEGWSSIVDAEQHKTCRDAWLDYWQRCDGPQRAEIMRLVASALTDRESRLGMIDPSILYVLLRRVLPKSKPGNPTAPSHEHPGPLTLPNAAYTGQDWDCFPVQLHDALVEYMWNEPGALPPPLIQGTEEDVEAFLLRTHSFPTGGFVAEHARLRPAERRAAERQMLAGLRPFYLFKYFQYFHLVMQDLVFKVLRGTGELRVSDFENAGPFPDLNLDAFAF